jgi:hypothetical protein
MKVTTIEKLMNATGKTKEERFAERVEEHKKEYEETTTDYLLGWYVGNELVHNFLPTLSIDMMQTRKVIQVSDEETNKFEEISSTEPWEKTRKYMKTLEAKYLPSPLRCFTKMLKYTDESQFKTGLRDSLWDCDMCAYNIEPENIKIETSFELGSSIITLVYDPDAD